MAAYNAGPGNVDKEFPETKKYVQNVTKSAGMELGNKPMNYTKEQIMQELEKRGHKSFPSTKESESLNKQTVYQELKRRGLDDTEIFKKLSNSRKV